jgi:hypothetical protein
MVNRRDLALQIDAEKRQLEVGITRRLNAIFTNLANDAAVLYKTTGSMPAAELSKNYSPEFLKEIRDAMRLSIKRFGFNLRGDLEQKGFQFDIENKRQMIDWNIKGKIKIIDENLNEKENQINDDFLKASTLFVANESEVQNNFVEDTNAKMLNESTALALTLFAASQNRKRKDIDDLNQELASTSGEDVPRLKNELSVAQREFENNLKNKDTIVAGSIKRDLLDKKQGRSELISAQNVGLAESWARQTEAQLINDAGLVAEKPIEVVKTWIAILDSKTRSSHAAADSQQVGINDRFDVGGESLKYPRDPNGSAGNIINCRCLSFQEIKS